MIVQIYEIQTPEEAEKVIKLGVNHAGSVILSAESWKNEEIKKTVNLVKKLGAKSSLIPLYSEPEKIFATIDFYRPDIIHFCEALLPFENIQETCAGFISLQKNIRRIFPGIKIMRSIPIPAEGSEIRTPFLETASMFEKYTDFFLTDTFIGQHGIDNSDRQPVPGFVGITGKICDPSMSSELVRISRIPVILAGGLSPENVYGLSVKIKPAGVDSCTLTNIEDNCGKPVRFKKDLHKVSDFVKEAGLAGLQIQKKSI